jgi:hypothetical protein
MAPIKKDKKTTTKRTLLRITWVNGWVMVWVISFDESDINRGWVDSSLWSGAQILGKRFFRPYLPLAD